MNVESGEYYIDLETGEVSLQPPRQNVETGEYEGCMRIKRFKIPSNNDTSNKKKPLRKPRKVDPLDSQLIRAAIFLLPTMIFFYPIVSVFVCITEILLHNWFHEKNKSLKNKAVYFRSPLHGIVKEMCGKCKEENATFKIAQLQDIKNDKFKNYIKRVVT